MKFVEKRGNVVVVVPCVCTPLVPLLRAGLASLHRTHLVYRVVAPLYHSLRVHSRLLVGDCLIPHPHRQFTNQYQRFILLILGTETVMNLLLVSLTDPGFILDESDYEDEIDKECPITCRSFLHPSSFTAICNLHIPYGTEHCQDCNLCVVDRDHHCECRRGCLSTGAWLGKCVGRHNMKYFSSFCFFLVISSVYIAFTNVPIIRRAIGSFVSLQTLRKHVSSHIR